MLLLYNVPSVCDAVRIQAGRTEAVYSVVAFSSSSLCLVISWSEYISPAAHCAPQHALE